MAIVPNGRHCRTHAGVPIVNSVRERIRAVLTDHARLSVPLDGLSDRDDLYAAGMTSHASVNVMLGLEAEFDVEFPDEMLSRSVFASVDSIAGALEALVKKERSA